MKASAPYPLDPVSHKYVVTPDVRERWFATSNTFQIPLAFQRTGEGWGGTRGTNLTRMGQSSDTVPLPFDYQGVELMYLQGLELPLGFHSRRKTEAPMVGRGEPVSIQL